MDWSDSESLTLADRVVIGMPPPAFWNVVRDLEAWPEWNPACPEAYWTSGTSWFVGSTFVLGLRLGGQVLPFAARLTAELDFPWILVWSLEGRDAGQGLTGEQRFELDWEGPRTIVDHRISLRREEGTPEPPFGEEEAIAMSRAWLDALKAEIERRGFDIGVLTGREMNPNAPRKDP